MATDDSFSPTDLAAQLKGLPATRRFWVGYSGGCDSTVLLHAMATLRQRLACEVHAIHVNHGLSADADAWSQHCVSQCNTLGIPCIIENVSVANQGKGVEAAARDARYEVMRALLEDGDILLTAHHREDQTETLLLQLLRGAGPAGLAAMPLCTRFGKGFLARPMLGFAREALRSYASHYDLFWVDDKSNFDVGFDRNFLRQEVLPILRQRWPRLDITVGRAAELQGEAAELMSSLAVHDLHRVAAEGGTLRIAPLVELDSARQRNVLRYWLRHRRLPVPAAHQIAQLQRDLLHAAADAQPVMRWPGAEVRRYRGRLYAMEPLPPLAADFSVTWHPEQARTLPPGLGHLAARKVRGWGVRAALIGERGLTVKLRGGGEAIKPTAAGSTRSLKNLFQEHDVPPWERERVPLFYIDDKLVAVGSYWVAAEAAAGEDEEGYEIHVT